MAIQTVPTRPFDDQKPGTSGLRKKVRVFQQPGYLQNFVQSVFDSLPQDQKQCLVIGGDGRYFNREATRIIIRMALANGYLKLIVGRGGILSTPAVSNLIRFVGADGGLVLSASHNPAGPDEDFGIKYNTSSGSPAPESVTGRIFENSAQISRYLIDDTDTVDLEQIGVAQAGQATIEVVDPVAAYVQCMKQCFDFDRLRRGFSEGRLSLRFDAMHAVTGPYARAIFVDELGAEATDVVNAEPKEDFGGLHPDPNLVHGRTLLEYMYSDQAPLLGAASDGDGDRNMILGQGCFVTPGDSLAIIAEHHRSIPQFAHGLHGVARSMPTSTAVDRVAEALGIECHETPTGWKFFGNLLDQSKISLCGEESFGTSGDHVREKDGLWAVLCWLSIVEAGGRSVAELLEAHWQKFGRSIYCRHDYEGISAKTAADLMADLQHCAEHQSLHERHAAIDRGDSFGYQDPVDHSRTLKQGIRLFLKDGSRIVYRLSGTGTGSATLRIYLEKFTRDSALMSTGLDTVAATADLAAIAVQVAGVVERTGLEAPGVIT